MKYIINNKIYNTETSKMILKYKKIYKSSLWKFTTNGIANLILYKSEKGNYFQIAQPEFSSDLLYEDCLPLTKEITNIEALNICIKYLPAERVIELFGELGLEEG